ncbi:Pilin/Flagellin PilA family [Methanonatronarchaeum thermophilum]|uniref:Pilin/Flagellin PilA family n=1 Tax=Methanonatronarchaeum thermophilum TaxID=1927129 RepID=A0A1Y3GA89_9EURY|nr:Pilin/Flagellin PilA family [Methanonatronarchaeum thermophilum]
MLNWIKNFIYCLLVIIEIKGLYSYIKDFKNFISRINSYRVVLYGVECFLKEIGLTDFVSEESGVSPVIGVIMMVSIVVLLAAVIAAFTFGVINLPAVTPTASISIEQAEINDEGIQITLLHESGETLYPEKTSLVVTNLNTSQTDTKNLNQSMNSDTWSTGERITTNIDIGNSEDAVYPEDEIEVRVVDLESGGTVGISTSPIS